MQSLRDIHAHGPLTVGVTIVICSWKASSKVKKVESPPAHAHEPLPPDVSQQNHRPGAALPECTEREAYMQADPIVKSNGHRDAQPRKAIHESTKLTLSHSIDAGYCSFDALLGPVPFLTHNAIAQIAKHELSTVLCPLNIMPSRVLFVLTALCSHTVVVTIILPRPHTVPAPSYVLTPSPCLLLSAHSHHSTRPHSACS
eukprot:1159008-Pelagomonas_calceolata.AAC.10